jgi:hypothetical protein
VPAGDAFLSFVRVRDPGRHRDYNRRHQLDHLPENRALPGPSEVEKAEQVLFEGLLETIVPRRWDWFDDEVAEEAAGGDRA